MKRIAAVMLALLLLSGCAWTEPEAEMPSVLPEQTLTVCIPRDRELWLPFVREFQQRTGIWVRVRTELQAEDNDVLLDYDPLETELSLTESVCVGNQVPVIVCNPQLIRKNAPAGLLDLAQAPWQGTLAFADPASSRFSRNVLALLRTLAPETSPEALIRAFSGAVAESVDSSRQVLEAVGSGTAAMGLVPESQALLALEEGIRLGVIVPGEGRFLLPILAGICSGAPNPENAGAFLAFLLEEDTQNHLRTFCRVCPASEENGIPFVPQAHEMESLLRLWENVREVQP